MKTKITTLSFVLFIITLFSCNKSNNITISIIDGFYSVLDEYGHSHWGDSSFTFDCTIRIYPLEYVTFDNYTYYDNRYEFNDVKLDTNLYYDIIFEGSNHQNFIINDYLFKPIITKKLIWAYLPQIIITEKSKAVITDFSIDSLRFITSPYMYTKGVFTVSGKVSKEENKPFRSFVIYLGDENVSSTNYDLKFNPKLSQENFNYFDDGSFIFTDTIRFGMSQNLHYLDCFYES
ncbi:MAG: hypothetical protein JXL97_13910, partial [Bacteroidales bacterium]|nr:hypothetical protein [Bacteroidales bacterium]